MAKIVPAVFAIIIVIAGAGSAATAVLSSPAGLIWLMLASLPALLCIGLALFVAAAFVLRYAAMAWIDVQKAAVFVAPDENGLLPVAKQALLTDTGAHRTIDVHLTKATAVPSHINYAPRWTGGNALPDSMGQVAQAFQPETFWQLWQGNKLPQHGFLMGYSLEDGTPVNATWEDLYSALVGGQSGSGKSTLIRSILAQSAMQGGRFVVLDKHYGAGEQSLGESLRTLRHLMLCDVAASEQQMVDALAYVRDIGEQRLAGAIADKTPVVLVVDETTAVLQRSATSQGLSDVLGQIAQETRKVGVYALCIGQNFHSKVMDTTVRDSFVSFISCRSRRRTAATMTDDNEFGKLAHGLTVGQALWMTPGGDVHKLAVPNCTKQDLELVASHLGAKTDVTVPKTTNTPVGATSLAPSPSTSLAPSLGAKERRILSMIASGKSTSEIIKELYGVKGGKKYGEAAGEVNKVMQYLAVQTLGGDELG